VPLVLEANASEVSWRRRWSRLRFGRVAAACERLLLRRADRIAAVSENAAKEIIAAGAPAERVRVIPNAVDVDRFASAPPVVLPFADDAFIVAFAGLFYPWHGVPTLARAFVELVGARPESRLLLVGDGASAPQVRAILREAGVDGLAYLPGLITREEVPGYLAASTVLVSPHVADRGFIGSPLKVFEYMASGRPIVSTRVAQLEQIFEDERTALLVAPDDPMALSQALVRLHDEPELRRSLGAAALHEARTKHTWDARLAALMA
jgi:glycosyltransferase involved in cell wall biosynthesis